MAQRRIVSSRKPDKSVTHPAFIGLVILIVSGAAIDVYLYLHQKKAQEAGLYADAQNESPISLKEEKVSAPLNQLPPAENLDMPVSSADSQVTLKKDSLKIANFPLSENVPPSEKGAEIPKPNSPGPAGSVQYMVAAPKVYFHTKPDVNTRRQAFLNHWNKTVLTPLDDQNGFIYIIYTNTLGQKSKGWLLKKDLKPVE